MYINSYNYTNKGKYPKNEDSFFCSDNIFIVADGLGGHGGGDSASKCAVQYISENYRSAAEIPELISGANNAVRELDNGSRSTVAAVFAEDGKLYYTNVGDSRVYFFRNGKILCRTKDHSVCQAAVDAGTMTEDDIRGHEDRSRLLRVLGEKESLKYTNYEPVELQDGDAFLICSDGFWDFVYETEMEIDLLKADSAKRWGDYMLRRHLKRSHGEDDNYTIVCGIVHTESDNIPHTSEPFAVTVSDGKEESKAARRLPLFIIVGAIVLAALCAAGYFLFKNKPDNNTPSSDNGAGTVTSISDSSESSSSDSGDVENSSSTAEQSDSGSSTSTTSESDSTSDTASEPESSSTSSTSSSSTSSSTTQSSTVSTNTSSSTTQSSTVSTNTSSSTTQSNTVSTTTSSSTTQSGTASTTSSSTSTVSASESSSTAQSSTVSESSNNTEASSPPAIVDSRS